MKFCDDPPEKIKKKIRFKIDEAKKKGISSSGKKRLSQIVDRHKTVFELRIGSGGRAKIHPMKINWISQEGLRK